MRAHSMLPLTGSASRLLSYGPNLPIMYRGLAVYISKILKGAKAGDLSVEQPTRFEFIVNPKTARAPEIKMRQTVLGRADEVIE